MMEAKQSGRLAQAQPARRKRPGTAKNHYRMAEMIEKIAMGYLSDKSKSDNFMNLYNQAFADKVSNAIVENISFKTSKIDVDKFKAIAAAL